jgi:uncharacterized protein (TIGR02118 family)
LFKISALYPQSADSTFDIEYYCTRHMPMVQALLGAVVARIEVERGVSGGLAGIPAGYVAAGHVYCESLEAFRDAYAPHAQVIRDDIRNYTQIQPVVQISEVVLQRVEPR